MDLEKPIQEASSLNYKLAELLFGYKVYCKVVKKTGLHLTSHWRKDHPSSCDNGCSWMVCEDGHDGDQALVPDFINSNPSGGLVPGNISLVLKKMQERGYQWYSYSIPQDKVSVFIWNSQEDKTGYSVEKVGNLDLAFAIASLRALSDKDV